MLDESQEEEKIVSMTRKCVVELARCLKLSQDQSRTIQTDLWGRHNVENLFLFVGYLFFQHCISN